MDNQHRDINFDSATNVNQIEFSRKFIRITSNLCLASALVNTVMMSLFYLNRPDTDPMDIIPPMSFVFLALIGISIIMNIFMIRYFKKHPEKKGSRSTLNKIERVGLIGFIVGTILLEIRFGLLLFHVL